MDSESNHSSHSSILGISTEQFPFLHKIDMYGSMFILWLIWAIPNMIDSLYDDHVHIGVPLEMLVHGPVLIFPGTDGHFRLDCNPLIHTFLNNPAFLTDDFMGAVLTKGKSEKFLQTAAVNESLDLQLEITHETNVYIGIRLMETCYHANTHHIFLHATDAECKSYDYIFNECIGKDCQHGIYLCWWSSLSGIRMVLLAHLLSFIPAIFIVFICMFDPPPAGFKLLAEPWMAAVSLCTSSGLGVVYFALAIGQIKKYLNQPIFYETYPSTETENGYHYVLSNGFQYTLISTVVNFIFGLCYLYVSCFTPSYPRHPSRYLQRMGFFKQQLKLLEIEAGLVKPKKRRKSRSRSSASGRTVTPERSRRKVEGKAGAEDDKPDEEVVVYK